MRVHLLERTQFVAGPLDDVFSFFENPHNLGRITPPWLHFRIVGTTDARVRVGTEIRYRLRWKGIGLGWTTRITGYDPGASFTDEMLRGPYTRWVHRHTFRAVPGGVEMKDRVEYALPFGPVGTLVHALIVRRHLEEIFDYRRSVIDRIFADLAAPAHGG